MLLSPSCGYSRQPSLLRSCTDKNTKKKEDGNENNTVFINDGLYVWLIHDYYDESETKKGLWRKPTVTSSAISSQALITTTNWSTGNIVARRILMTYTAI